MLDANAAPTLRIGAYVGALSDQSLINITVLRPWVPNFASGILVDTLIPFTRPIGFKASPLDLEIEGGVAKRFGSREAGQQWEFDLIPMARWTYFPWNDYIDTNFRLGLIGASYVTGISEFERQFDSSGHSSRFLNLLVPEITVSPYKEAPFEDFVRVHLRSGVYGLITESMARRTTFQLAFGLLPFEVTIPAPPSNRPRRGGAGVFGGEFPEIVTNFGDDAILFPLQGSAQGFFAASRARRTRLPAKRLQRGVARSYRLAARKVRAPTGLAALMWRA